MRNGFMTLPSNISDEAEFLKSKVVNTLDDIERAYRKDIKKKAQENIQKMVESIERAGMKRLTLISHEDIEHERLKRFKEKRLEEEKKRREEEEAQ
ncbi:hypothetical protein A2U01_0028919 [Trifolium medium]|uniref:Uncharacterized protein n=1 Tax=Trifolium medium TaxID=97028 RepID=A0A392P8U1_9FABA|nr:hypothetical protein [Trifolium medium]